MPVPAVLDVTYLISRLPARNTDGFANVNTAFARHFLNRPETIFACREKLQIRELGRHHAVSLVGDLTASDWHEGTEHSRKTFDRLRRILAGQDAQERPEPTVDRSARGPGAWLADRRLRLKRYRLRKSPRVASLPKGACYLDVSQFRMEVEDEFTWLADRPDIKPVFLIHDLLPLDYPEFFLEGEEARFSRRIDTMFRHGRGFIVTSEAVAERLRTEFARRGRNPSPILVAPLPSPLARPGFDREAMADPALSRTPYYVMIATIEPRKNHLLLLGLWRAMAEAARSDGAQVPKLVLVGSRWKRNEQVVDVLDRGKLTKPHVLEFHGLAQRDLATLLVNARGLLLPSHAEGYGLPIVEALSLGVPVIASDIPVFREVSQGCAVYHHPMDGAAWRGAILDLSDRDSPAGIMARSRASAFRAPTWDGYFKSVSTFLEGL